MIYEGTEEAINTRIGYRSTLHLAIHTGHNVLLVEKGLGQTAGQAALEGQQQTLQVDAEEYFKKEKVTLLHI